MKVSIDDPYAPPCSPPDQLEQEEQTLRQSLQALAQNGASAASLDAARRYLEGQHQLRWQDRRARGRLLAERELFGLPLDAGPTWNDVDAEGIRRIAAASFVARPSAAGLVQGNQSDPEGSEDPGS